MAYLVNGLSSKCPIYEIVIYEMSLTEKQSQQFNQYEERSQQCNQWEYKDLNNSNNDSKDLNNLTE